jgi:acetyl esterase/lipase
MSGMARPLTLVKGLPALSISATALPVQRKTSAHEKPDAEDQITPGSQQTVLDLARRIIPDIKTDANGSRITGSNLSGIRLLDGVEETAMELDLDSRDELEITEIADRVMPCHDQFWGSEEAMAEGSPTRALERGEKVEMPPALYLQGTADKAHPKPDRERFVESYRNAGGRLELELFEGESEGFVGKNPNSPAAERAIEKIIEFVHRQLN